MQVSLVVNVRLWPKAVVGFQLFPVIKKWAKRVKKLRDALNQKKERNIKTPPATPFALYKLPPLLVVFIAYNF